MREILSEHGAELDERPSVTWLQGEARAAGSEPDEDVVVLPDLEAGGLATSETHEDAPPAGPASKRRRRRWLGIWTHALAGLLGGRTA